MSQEQGHQTVPDRSNQIVQCLWIGESLGVMERLSLSSFVACGHACHLYCYRNLREVPAGVVQRDANEILPEHSVFAYQTGFGKGSVSAFSNVFRYKLLLERGGWWTDTDVVCLSPFDFTEDVVIGTERTSPTCGDLVVSSSVLKQPCGSELMAWAWAQCERADRASVQWGQIGPRLLQRGVDAIGWQDRLKPECTFSPIPHWDCRCFVDDRGLPAFSTETLGVHLWHQMWLHENLDPDGSFPESSFYEQVKRRYLRDSTSLPR